MHQVRRTPTTVTQVDAFGPCWGLMIGSLPRKKVAVRRDGHWHWLEGNVACYLPPFSVVEWRIEPGVYRSRAIFSIAKPQDDWPRKAVAVSLPTLTERSTPDALLPMLFEASNSHEIARADVAARVAPSAKLMIDQTFDQGVSLAEIARQLGVAPATLSRSFHHCYGITPVQYRTRIRLYDSIRRLVRGIPVTETSLDVGFNDLSLFIKQFKRELSTPPGTFSCHHRPRPPRPNAKEGLRHCESLDDESSRPRGPSYQES